MSGFSAALLSRISLYFSMESGKHSARELILKTPYRSRCANPKRRPVSRRVETAAKGNAARSVSRSPGRLFRCRHRWKMGDARLRGVPKNGLNGAGRSSPEIKASGELLGADIRVGDG